MRFIALCLMATRLFAFVSFDESMGPVWTTASKERTFFQKLYERNHFELVKKSQTPRIPRIIHQIWIGSELPRRYQRFCKSWEEKNPSWEYKLWTDKDIASLNLKNQEIFDKSRNYGFKSDILRYEILKKYGGVYVDTDYECLMPLDDFIHAHDFFAGLQQGDEVGNAFLASAPDHPLLNDFIDRIGTVEKFNMTPEEVLQVTGPIYITKRIISYIKEEGSKGICIYPCSYFFPLPHTLQKEFWSGKITPGQLKTFLKPESAGIHYWATSWQ